MGTSDTVLKIIVNDPYLKPYQYEIEQRIAFYHQTLNTINKNYKNLTEYASWHKEMGFHQKGKNIVFREWAPNAHALYLVGDFNNWDRSSHPLTKDEETGIWTIECPIPLNSKIKICIHGDNGVHDRLPAFTRSTMQDTKTHDFGSLLYLGQESKEQCFSWTDDAFSTPQKDLCIYECHVGMATEEHRVGQYREFADTVLPKIADSGYNCIQLMAVMEHPYYGSFGYHVSNVYAASSRFGSPQDLKYLINRAHELGVAIVMDLVHSHAVKNFDEGLVDFDGSDLYFHGGDLGYHELWDSMLYNYSKTEVQRYLLSNLHYWLEEFHIDGFRFDGVTSMLYYHHGFNTAFTHYDMYFDGSVDVDSFLYLQLATSLIHQIKPDALCIAEDMSGMPGLCCSIENGGIGFDYRLAMGVPDYWIKTIKEKTDEQWDMSEIYHQLSNRRVREKTITYAESHDQALVGDKTIAFRLMDQAMYYDMSTDSHSHIIDRGIALHKLIRLITLSLGGDAYLNFMGNEFGHPEWIDFPREGNNFSYLYARRQWSLRDNTELRYIHLAEFDKAMLYMARESHLLSSGHGNFLNLDTENKVLCVEKAGLILVFCFNPEQSFPNYRIGVPKAGSYEIILSSDEKIFGGFDRIRTDIQYFTQDIPMHGHAQSLELYVCNRTTLVFREVKK